MHQCVAILQARMSSRRLPGKVLLDLTGMPFVILAAKRAMNTGMHLIVATSDEASDDPLIETLSRFRIPFFRGPLHDPLKRFELALASYPDETTVVRLTGDNAFPDGAFISQILKDYQRRPVDILTTSGPDPEDGLPEGLESEVFSLKCLREAAHQATAPYEREHVTPWMRRNLKHRFFIKYQHLDFGLLRSTMDTPADYERLKMIFARVSRPLEESWYQLCEELLSMGQNLRPTTPSIKTAIL